MKHKKEKRYYAMKMIGMIGIPESEKESIRTELKLLQQFTHPNIVSYRVY